MNDHGLRPLLLILILNTSVAGAARCSDAGQDQIRPLLLADSSRPQADKSAGNVAATGSKPALSSQTAERIQRIHDEQAHAIETRQRALDLQIKAVEQEMQDELSGLSPANANGITDVFYEKKVVTIKDAAEAKIKGLRAAFEVEKKRTAEIYERQARDFQKSQSGKSNSSAAVTDNKPAVSRQVTERLQRIHDEGAQAIETRQRALDTQIKAVEQETAEAVSAASTIDARGVANPNYKTDVANIKESGDAKVKALRDAFETEKKRVTEIYDRQARDYETSQQARSGAQKPTARQ
jgi:hypothetical protein